MRSTTPASPSHFAARSASAGTLAETVQGPPRAGASIHPSSTWTKTLPDGSRRTSARVSSTRSRFVSFTGRQTGSPSMSTRAAAVFEKTMAGGSFLTDSSLALRAEPSTASAASTRSRGSVAIAFGASSWKAAWYSAALAGAAGKLARVTFTSSSATVRAPRSTRVEAATSTTPKIGWSEPFASTEQAAWPVTT